MSLQISNIDIAKGRTHGFGAKMAQHALVLILRQYFNILRTLLLQAPACSCCDRKRKPADNKKAPHNSLLKAEEKDI